MDKEYINQIERIFNKNNVLSDKEDLISHSYDGTRLSFLPDLVVLPESEGQIIAFLKYANANLIPVYLRGAGTGLSGGALPVKKGVVIDFSKMNNILEINKKDLYVRVQPGVICGKLQKEVSKFNLIYPPDPASSPFCTIGGNIAENAGGLRGVKYGVTQDYVIQAKVILPNGELFHLGKPTLKRVTGYNILNLLIGSEGTLGVFTEFTLRLIPAPETVQTILTLWDSEENAINSGIELLSSSNTPPRAMEFMDETTISAVRNYLDLDWPANTTSALLVEFDGSTNEVQSNINASLSLLNKANPIKIELAIKPEEIDALWNARRACSPALYSISEKKMSEDIVVPKSNIINILKLKNKIATKYNILIAGFGHLGDGNIHMNFLATSPNEASEEYLHTPIKELFECVIELNGTLSGEHGIGLTKAEFLELELSKEEIEISKKLKNIFDPNNILNPGKLFDFHQNNGTI